MACGSPYAQGIKSRWPCIKVVDYNQPVRVDVGGGSLEEIARERKRRTDDKEAKTSEAKTENEVVKKQLK